MSEEDARMSLIDRLLPTGTAETSAERTRVGAIHRRLADAGHELPVRLWDGTELGPTDAPFRLVLHAPWSLRAMVVPLDDRTAGEAFITDAFDVEGSMVAALRAVADLRAGPALAGARLIPLAADVRRLPRPPARDVGRRGRLRGRRHSRRRDRGAVASHYDVGNGFYELFLDERLVYSCAYFTDDDDSLDRAQERKLELVCRKLHLRPGERLLDIGCGWGSLVLHAATQHGVHAVGITLSEAQAEVARRRVAEAGLADRVEIRLEDYRDVAGSYDAVASIGMFEHVGEERFELYFSRAFELTGPGGRFLNHAITTGRRREVRDLSDDRRSFIGRYVFPDGALAPASEAVRLMEDAGFELIDVEQLRPHYARTLRDWTRRLEGNAGAARQLVGEEVFRTWRAYLAGSVIGFEGNDLGVVQVLGSKGATLPLGRHRMLPPSRSGPSPGRTAPIDGRPVSWSTGG